MANIDNVLMRKKKKKQHLSQCRLLYYSFGLFLTIFFWVEQTTISHLRGTFWFHYAFLFLHHTHSCTSTLCNFSELLLSIDQYQFRYWQFLKVCTPIKPPCEQFHTSSFKAPSELQYSVGMAPNRFSTANWPPQTLSKHPSLV